MSRSRLWRAAAALGFLGAGCAHCDTCDEVPVPCTGPNCNASLNVAPIAAPAPGPMATSPGPFAAPGPVISGPITTVPVGPPAAALGAAGGVSTPNFAVPPLPDVPANAPSPPPGPAAPEKP